MGTHIFDDFITGFAQTLMADILHPPSKEEVERRRDARGARQKERARLASIARIEKLARDKPIIDAAAERRAQKAAKRLRERSHA